jgi:hypothetical protein
MNSKSYSKAVAAVTGRGFKSHQPDNMILNADSEFDVAVLVSSTEIK